MSVQPDDNGQDDIKNILGGEVDPMKWLESLAARQGANPEEFVTTADMDLPDVADGAMADEPGYVDYDPFGSNTPAASTEDPDAKSASAPTPKTPPGPMASDVNPLAWLESLAKRQGANPEEFVTAADVDVPQVDPDTVLDEPGYTPYEDSTKAEPKPVAKATPASAAPAKSVPAAAAPEIEEGELSTADAAALLGISEDQLIPPVAEVPPPPAAPAAPASDASDPLSGHVDPLAWLESLARRQGAKAEELITSADLDIPEASAEAVADEPGYEDYSPFAEQEEDLEPVAEEAPAGDNMLEWLEGLAVEQGAAPLPAEAAVTEQDIEEEITEGAAQLEVETEAVGVDPLAGLTTEQIELKAAAGDLTPEQMEAWLRRQVESLALLRDETEMEDYAVEDALGEEVTPAEPAEIPAWLKSQAQVAAEEAASAPEPAPLVEDIIQPPAPDGLPDWLARKDALEEELDLAALLADDEFDTDVLEAIELELAAESDVEKDAWAVALDDEYQSQQLGDLVEPDWYRKALAGEKEEEPEVEPAVPAAAKDKLPDWLEGAEDKAAASLNVPDWLHEPAAAKASSIPDDLDWLVEIGEQAMPAAAETSADWISADVEAEIDDDWLVEIPDEPLPVAVAETAPVEKPVEKPVLTPPVPASAGHRTLRSKLEQNPQDHAARLQLARALQKDASVKACLDEYEELVSVEVMLDEVERDISALIEAQPALPPARRILGDIKMRQGKLQEALDTYRAALEQL